MLTITYQWYDFNRWKSSPQTEFFYDTRSQERFSRTDHLLQEQMVNLSKIYQENYGVWPLGRKVLSQDGFLPPDIKPVHLFGWRERSRMKDFKKRCATGEIIILPYRACKADIQYSGNDRCRLTSSKVGDFPVSPGSSVIPELSLSKPFYKNRWGDVYFENAPKTVYQTGDGFRRLMFDTVSTPLFQSVEQRGFPVDPAFSYEGVESHLTNVVRKHETLDHVLIQDYLGRANAGDADILTALAELPKTVQSVYDGFALIAKIFRDARRKEFKLLATVPTREKRLAMVAHKEYRLRKLRKIRPYEFYRRRDPSYTRKEYEDWLDQQMKNILDLDQFLANRKGVYRKRALREVADAIASVHLNVQYNIKPTVYTIQDSLKAIKNFGKTFRRYGNGNKPLIISIKDDLDSIIRDSKFTGEAYVEKRVFIKRSYAFTDSSLEKLTRVVSADALVTGYELVKLWSIIFDWFWTIGPMLRAIPWNQGYAQQKACFSYKTVIKGQITWKDPNGVDHRSTIGLESFTREIINPSASIGIYWNPEINGTRAFSALSFLFMSVNSSLKKKLYLQ